MSFEKQIGPLIDTVWKAETRLRKSAKEQRGRYQRPYLSWGEIYDMYNRASGKKIDRTALQRFLDALRAIEKQHAANALLQSVASLAAVTKKDALKDSKLAEEAWLGFYQFWNPKRDRSKISRRVYVNAPDPKKGADLLGRVVSMFDEARGLHMAKISGPGVKRVDRIVIYTTDDSTADAVIQRLQEARARHFGKAVPAGTKQVAPGISRADEPGNLSLEFAGAEVDSVRRVYVMPRAGTVSFGEFYAKALQLALGYPDGAARGSKKEHESLPKDRSEYKDQVQLVLRLCGIDLNKPHEISRSAAPAMELVRRGHAAMKRRGYTQKVRR